MIPRVEEEEGGVRVVGDRRGKLSRGWGNHGRGVKGKEERR